MTGIAIGAWKARTEAARFAAALRPGGRLLFSVELPLALPSVMAGLRVATVSTVALTTVGSIVGYGGLGNLLLEAVNTQFRPQVLTASVLCVLLAVTFDLLLVGAQRLMMPWNRGRAA